MIGFCEVTSCFILKIHGHQLPLLFLHLFPGYLLFLPLPLRSSLVSYLLWVLWTISWSICVFWVIFILFPPDVCFFFVRAVLPSHWSFIRFVISNFVPCLYGMLKSAFVQEKNEAFLMQLRNILQQVAAESECHPNYFLLQLWSFSFLAAGGDEKKQKKHTCERENCKTTTNMTQQIIKCFWGD